MFEENQAPAEPAPEKTPAATRPMEPEPVLPETPKLKLEDVRTLIAAQHDTTVARDDPILMVVTIMNGFLESLQILLNRHNQAVTGLMTEKTEAYVKAVKETSDRFSQMVSEASVKAIREIFEQHNRHLSRFKNDLFWLGAIIVCAALGNLIGLTVLK